MSFEEFENDSETQDAVLRRLEIIGEAVKSIPSGVRSRYPGLPWKEISGMRDVLIHAYFGVVLKRIWIVLEDDLPELEAVMLEIYEKEGKKRV
jgi:uncharacterized protein with HEPN domain